MLISSGERQCIRCLQARCLSHRMVTVDQVRQSREDAQWPCLGQLGNHTVLHHGSIN